MEWLGSHWTAFYEIWFDIWVCLEASRFTKIWQEYWVLYMNTSIHFWSYLPRFFLERQIFYHKIVEQIITRILSPIIFFLENRVVCEIKWKILANPGKPQMITWRLRIAWWIPKATNAHSEYVIIIAFLLQQWLDQYASMLHYTYIGILVITETERVHRAVQTERINATYLNLSLRRVNIVFNVINI
jgi:hypothetical protein